MFSRVSTALRSKNPAARLEGQVADSFKSSLVSFQREVKAGNTIVGEIDIELKSAIIEVTTGSGRGKANQISRLVNDRSLNPSGKPVVLYAPEITAGRAKNIQDAGGHVARNMDELNTIVNQGD